MAVIDKQWLAKKPRKHKTLNSFRTNRGVPTRFENFSKAQPFARHKNNAKLQLHYLRWSTAGVPHASFDFRAGTVQHATLRLFTIVRSFRHIGIIYKLRLYGGRMYSFVVEKFLHLAGNFHVLRQIPTPKT